MEEVEAHPLFVSDPIFNKESVGGFIVILFKAQKFQNLSVEDTGILMPSEKN